MDAMCLLDACRNQGIRYFCGVPDSLLKGFCACIAARIDENLHVVASNEGNAIGLAVGWFLGTGEPALVYMQNSGLGNCVNPLLSLADPEVYSIPMLLVVGWRGMRDTKDEPQHVKQGRVTDSLLGTMEIPYYVLEAEMDNVTAVVADACDTMRQRMMPVALLVKPGTFETGTPPASEARAYPLVREEALKCIVGTLESDNLIVSTTGKLSRELYEYRKSSGGGASKDFLTVGSMGHASSIAMGLASARRDRMVVCLDGDGSALMHMGAMAIIGQRGPPNLIHVLFNNGSHDSVGGQPTVGYEIDWVGIARSCGYRFAISASESGDVIHAMERLRNHMGPVFLEIRVSKGARAKLARPELSPIENRDLFMKNIGTMKRW